MAKDAFCVVTADTVVERSDAVQSFQVSGIALLIGLVPVARTLPNTLAVVLELFFQ
ncbi:hypothetical protein D3C71_1731030 [compost metagenome]